jgi:cytochrome c556
VRKVRADLKSNNSSRAKKLMWADYEDFEEDANDFSDDGFEDETIGYKGGF